MSRSSSHFVTLILLAALVVGGTIFWWFLRSERLARGSQPAVLATPQPVLATIAVDTEVSFQAHESEVSTSVQNFPDFSPLPTTCSPFQSMAAYSGIAVNQAETVITWDTSMVRTENPEKLQNLLALEQTLNSLTQMADAKTHRLPLQAEWDQQSLFPWNDPNCLTIIPDFYPVLIKEVSLPNIDQAWYLESVEGTGNRELPVTRRLFVRRESRWVVLSELKSSQQELGIDSETLSERLETTCKASEDERADVVACLAQIWFGEYRKPEVSDQWITEITNRLQW